jgi:hypothetical protein
MFTYWIKNKATGGVWVGEADNQDAALKKLRLRRSDCIIKRLQTPPHPSQVGRKQFRP